MNCKIVAITLNEDVESQELINQLLRAYPKISTRQLESVFRDAGLDVSRNNIHRHVSGRCACYK